MDTSLLVTSPEDADAARAEDEKMGLRLGEEALSRVQRGTKSTDALQMEMQLDRDRRLAGVEDAEFTAVDRSQFFNMEKGKGYQAAKVVRQPGRKEDEAKRDRVVDMRQAKDKRGKKSAAELVKANLRITRKQERLLSALALQRKRQGPLKVLRLALQQRLEAKLKEARSGR